MENLNYYYYFEKQKYPSYVFKYLDSSIKNMFNRFSDINGIISFEKFNQLITNINNEYIPYPELPFLQRLLKIYTDETYLPHSNHIQNFPELAIFNNIVAVLCHQYFLKLGLIKYLDLNQQYDYEFKTLVLNDDYVRGFLHPQVWLADHLKKILDRDKALDIVKRIVDLGTERNSLQHINTVNEFISPFLSTEIFYSAFNKANFKYKDGKAGTKITKCRWANILLEVTDPETAYSIACHYDFKAAQKHNSNFVLTRTKTCAEGQYCDFIWHDTSIDNNLEHPNGNFWDNISDIKDLSPAYLDARNRISDIYNSGKTELATEEAKRLFEQNANKLEYKMLYAVMLGDYSYDVHLDEPTQQQLRADAKKLIQDVFESDDLKYFPLTFINYVKNEYYYFFDKHEDQYNLGQEKINLLKDLSGSYSCCVGATQLALKLFRQSELAQAKTWAQKAIDNFNLFESVSPTWYNINYFAAKSYALLGQTEEAINCFKDIYRKQNAPEVNDQELQKFIEEMNKLGVMPLTPSSKHL